MLRPLAASDLDAVAVIERRAYAHGWTRGIFEDCLRVGYCCWGVEDLGTLAGYGITAVGARECHLLNLAVDPACQRRGLGRLMLHHLMAIAGDWGAEAAFLEVRPSNAPARALYAEAGFEECGRRRGYYPRPGGGREDALVLRRRL